MPSMAFSRVGKYPYRKGRIYLGKSPLLRRPVGIATDRHMLTIAGARSGKGVCLIMPNLKRWPHNTLVIDPKGEAAEQAIKWREDFGQTVHVVDPFESARVPHLYRAQYNPLDDLDPASLTIREDIAAVADGTVMRVDPKSAMWDDGARDVIAGVIGWVLLEAPDDKKNLLMVRDILRDADQLKTVVAQMKSMSECAGVCLEAVARITAKEGEYYVSGARRNTAWLDSHAMRNALAKSSFSLNDLKTKDTSIFLVLPANYLDEHGRFLRLFVRASIEAMARKTARGELLGKRCLFLLDEFFSLGRIDLLQKSAGLMPGYGVHLWPILQDLGQLEQLYEKTGAQTFFGNADAHIFFGNTDPATLEQISHMIGQRHEAGMLGYGEKSIGKPLMSTREIKAHVAKRDRNVVARRMIVFAKGDDVLSVRPAPFFKRW